MSIARSASIRTRRRTRRRITARLVELAAHPKVVGIGETGLDYYYDKSPRDQQKSNFRRHMQAAIETGVPLIVHTRDADDDMAQMLARRLRAGGVERGAALLHLLAPAG